MQFRSLGREGPLEEEMATRSSLLAWRISWTEKPGGLQAMEADWASEVALVIKNPLAPMQET